MKNIIDKNIWIIAFALALLTLLAYKAIETGNCVETDFKSFKAGACVDQ